MAQDFLLPELGENIETATVIEVFVKAGDSVTVDQALMSLETDKAEFELPSSLAGTVAEVLVKAGSEVRVGQAVLKIEGGAAAAEAKKPAAEPEKKEEKTVEAEPEAKAPPKAEPKEAAKPEAEAKAPAPETGPIAAAPSVRKLARELGIKLDEVASAAGRRRLTSDDIRAFKTGKAAPAAASPQSSPFTPLPLPDFSKWGEIRIEEMSKIRRRTAENMARAWIEIPQVTHHDDADITKLDALRKKYAPRVKEAGGQLTWTVILLHVLAGALKKFPQFNTSVDMAGNRIIYKDYVHIGVAVDTERGLLVPVIRDVDKKNIVTLAKELRELSEAARGRNIKPDQMQGATFTITNLGGVGGVAFSPIVNPPQVAILGVSRGGTRPVWVSDKFEPREVLPLTLSYDHRVIDGADAARFLRWVCEALREPFINDLEGL